MVYTTVDEVAVLASRLGRGELLLTDGVLADAILIPPRPAIPPTT